MKDKAKKSPYILLNKFEEIYQNNYSFSILEMIKYILIDIKNELKTK